MAMRLGQVRQIARCRIAGEQADAVEHHARRAAAVDDVFQSRLARSAAGP